VHAILLLLLAAPYELPAGDPIPAPSGALRVRIEAQLAALRDTDAIEAARAVRALALIGEPALPSVVKRINAAEAGERVLLLAAMSKVPRAAPLMVHARDDASPTVRAWVTLPKRPRDPPLAELAKRYLRVLSIAEKTRSDEAQNDIAGKRWVGPEGETIDLVRVERRPAFERARENMRDRMEDRTLAAEVHRQRLEAALDFAHAGARELRSGAWNASMDDPLFVTYLALLREEHSAFHVAAEAVVRLGAAGAPMLESLLHDDTFEARTLLMLLRQMRPDGGRGLFAATWRTEVRRALYDMAREMLPETEVRALARSGALDEEATIRKVALDLLLSFDAPEGRDLARGLLDPAKYGQAEFKRAAKLLARARQADDLKLLEELATLVVLRDGTQKSIRMDCLRSAAVRALTKHAGPETAAIAARFAASSDPRLRSLGIDMMVDPESLAKHFASETGAGARAQSAARLWTLGGPKYTELLAGEIRRDLSSRARASLVRSLRQLNAVAPLVALVSDENSDVRAVVLGAFSNLDHIDGAHAATLLAAHKNATDADERQLALAALLPPGIGSPSRFRSSRFSKERITPADSTWSRWPMRCPNASPGFSSRSFKAGSVRSQPAVPPTTSPKDLAGCARGFWTRWRFRETQRARS